MYTTLIEPAELATHLSDPDWAVLDCRFELTQPQWGAGAYATGHIPNALYAHLDRDLSDPVRADTGRHPLPAPERLADTFGRWGIDERVQVIAYDQANSAYAARLWWLLRWLGHPAVAVLNGGFAGWQRAGLPIQTDPVHRPPRSFGARPSTAHLSSTVVSTPELEQALRRGELEPGNEEREPPQPRRLLVDARSADRFAGQNETLDPVAGHVPGARNHPFATNLDAHGRFLSAQELRSRWETTLRGCDARQVIAMCGSGVTACHDLLALEIAGFTGARLYAGSWSEWIRDPSRPVTRGT